jgi:hypothetical protein
LQSLAFFRERLRIEVVTPESDDEVYQAGAAQGEPIPAAVGDGGEQQASGDEASAGVAMEEGSGGEDDDNAHLRRSARKG